LVLDNWYGLVTSTMLASCLCSISDKTEKTDTFSVCDGFCSKQTDHHCVLCAAKVGKVDAFQDCCVTERS
jgi:hypothetical protein